MYQISPGNLAKFQNLGIAQCARCSTKFEELDVIASSASGRKYCYNCAIRINLVSGVLNQDLNIDEKISQARKCVMMISQSIYLDIKSLNTALELIDRAYKKQTIPTNNEMGLAAAAVHIAYEINHNKKIQQKLPVTKQSLHKNESKLRSILTSYIMEKSSCH